MTPYPPPPPPPYTSQGPRMPPPQKYWYEGPPRRGPYGGPPYPPYEGPETRPPPPPHLRSGYGGEGRPYGGAPEYYPHRHEGYPPPSFRTPQRGTAALVQTSSFSSSSKEEEAVPPVHKNSDWEPTRSAADQRKDPKQKQGGDPLSFLAKVAMAPQDDEAKVKTHIAPNSSSDDSPSRGVRSSPIITPSSAPPPREPPPHYYREPPHPPPPHGATPKPITPTTAHYGPRTGPYDEPRTGPYYTPYPQPYPPFSGYDSRAASWEQPAVVVEERSSFDSLESAAPRPPAWGSPPYAHPQWYHPPPVAYESPYASHRPAAFHRGGYYGDDRAFRGPPYAPPPRDEKTVLRKKFSWKHFPEVRIYLSGNE
jgi:hypothetical protein